MSNPKEVNFFQDNLTSGPNPNYEKGWQWYQQAFSHYRGEPVVGEASPLYSERHFSPNTAKRIQEFNPDMKIVYLVRHPLERQISAWKMLWATGMNGGDSIGERWAAKGFDYWMCKGMIREWDQWDGVRYHYQLEAYLEHFPAKQIMVSFLEDWKLDKDWEVARIMQFLDLNPEKCAPGFQEAANRAEDRVIDRPLLKKIRLHPLSRMVVTTLPGSLRNWARGSLARTKATPPEPELSADTRTEFIRFVKPDTGKFLKQWRKPCDYWVLT